MSNNTHILIFEHDIVKYPPILSLITFLFSENKKVVFIGYCSSKEFVDDFENKGGTFYNVINNNIKDNSFIKLYKYFLFKKRVNSLLKKEINTVNIWLLGEQCTWLLHSITYCYRTNIYLFEIPSLIVSFRYKLLSPLINYKEVLQTANKVICCEYNRAHITQSFFQLVELPIIIPNKPLFSKDEKENKIEKTIIEKFKNKKVILYQGIFNYPERRMDSFCEAIFKLPEDFILCLMGSENNYKKQLKEKYNSDRIIFLDYISAPYHLQITRLAYIGILVYNSEGGNIENTLNTLYCAPNKIYEYAKFGVPMISNDVPALNFLFEKHQCGKSIKNTTEKDIISAILEIEKNHQHYSDCSFSFYEESDNYNEYLKLL
ncbi:glycosyltransferase [Myroides odoratimimus]|uniref:glycosyltransferase n=1 Tax=Myroides odoratimimus TaxID=76832 RepID=UPI002DB5E126|nr:glycosyltransferase [Myroides odoratimimus]MEC4086896.1 glycosyltransferase [Myroides odoratimimus]